MSGDKAINSYYGAVHECLELCYRSPAPLASLAEYLAKLRADRWRQHAIDKVEAAVLRVLTAVAVPEVNDKPAPAEIPLPLGEGGGEAAG